MENEQQNTTVLESANQEAIRLGREFLDGIEQNSTGVSTDEPEVEPVQEEEQQTEVTQIVEPIPTSDEPTVNKYAQVEFAEGEGKLLDDDIKAEIRGMSPKDIDALWESIHSKRRGFLGFKFGASNELTPQEIALIEFDRARERMKDEDNVWRNFNPFVPNNNFQGATNNFLRRLLTLGPEVRGLLQGKDVTPASYEELGLLTPKSPERKGWQGVITEEMLSSLGMIMPALFTGGGASTPWMLAITDAFTRPETRNRRTFTGQAQEFLTSDAVKGQVCEWQEILHEGYPESIRSCPGITEITEPLDGSNKSNVDNNVHVQRAISVAEIAVMERVFEWGLGKGFTGSWHLLKQIPIEKLNEITGPIGVMLRNMRNNLESTFAQKKEIALQQLQRSGFGAFKNPAIKTPDQGFVLPKKSPLDVKKDLDIIDGELGGSTKGPNKLTEHTIRSIAKKGNTKLIKQNLDDTAKELLGDSRYQEIVSQAKAQGKTFKEFFEPSFNRYQEIMGRLRPRMSLKSYWKPLQEGKQIEAFGGLTREDILAIELTNASNLFELQNLAHSTKNQIGVSDIFAPDGPLRAISDRLVSGISMIKRARFLQEAAEQGLNEADIAARITGMHDETVDGVKLMMKLMKDSDSNDLAHGVLEVFSSSNKIQNQLDFDKWMRQKISGGEFNGKVRTGVLVKELQQVMTNSMLLGPKTPQRAIFGTGFNTYLDQFNTVLGAAIRFGLGKTDDVTLKANTAALSGMLEIIPDALKVFRQRLDANFDKNLATVKSRFSHYSTKEHNWEMYRAWTEKHGTLGDKAAFFIADVGHKLNINRFLSGVPRVLRANDETFEWIATKGRTKELAMRQVLSEESSSFPVINEKTLSKVQDNLFNQYFDADGNLDISKDLFLKQRAAETTLQENMGNLGETLNRMFETLPQLKPFFFFMRTGVNSLKVNVRNQPLLAAMLKQQRQIAFGTAEDVKSGVLQRWGITTVQELENAKSLLWGRQALGIGLVSIGVQKYLHNGLNGNGPQNRAMRKMWQDTGWERGRIEIAGKMVDLNLFEPWSIMFKAIADVGDNQGLMGDEWVEDRLSALAWIIAGNATSTTFLQGANQLIDIFSAQPGARTRTISNIFNNQVPGANLRNAIGKVLNPGLREFDSNILDQIRSRNLTSELLTNKPLAFKYSILDGEKLKDYHPLNRFLNDTTIFNFTPKNDAGEQLLHDSNYDMRLSVTSTPSLGPQVPSISLIDNAELRSAFGRYIGQTRINGLSLRDRLNLLAKDKKIIASLKAMREDQRNGNYGYDPMKTYYHNDKIDVLFDQYRKKGYATMIQQMRLGKHPELENLLNENLELTKQMRRRRYETQQEPTPIPLHLGR